MADVSDSDSISAVPAAPSGPGREPRDHPDGREPPPEGHAHPPRDIADVAFVMGIPESELTSKVRDALGRLMAEFDRQRAEIVRLRERIGHLEAFASRDPIVPAGNRRAFERDFAHIQESAARSQIVSSLLCLRIANLEGIRSVHGRAAAEAASAYLVRVVAAELGDADSLASLGTGDVIVILALTQGAAARRKADGLVRAFERQSFAWRGAIVGLDIRLGLAAIDPGDTAESALERAEPPVDVALRR